MPQKNIEEDPRNFLCKATLWPDHKDVYIQLHIASAEVPWKGCTQRVEYQHLYVRLALKGCEFDQFTLTNTSGISTDNKILISVNTSDLLSNEKSTDESYKAGVSMSPLAEMMAGRAEKFKNEETKGHESSANVTDLRFELSKTDAIEPKWKVYQMNSTPLTLDPEKSYKLGKLTGQISPDIDSTTGEVWTSHEGYKIKGEIPGAISSNFEAIGNLMRQLWERKVKRDIVKPKPIKVDIKPLIRRGRSQRGRG